MLSALEPWYCPLTMLELDINNCQTPGLQPGDLCEGDGECGASPRVRVAATRTVGCLGRSKLAAAASPRPFLGRSPARGTVPRTLAAAAPPRPSLGRSKFAGPSLGRSKPAASPRPSGDEKTPKTQARTRAWTTATTRTCTSCEGPRPSCRRRRRRWCASTTRAPSYGRCVPRSARAGPRRRLTSTTAPRKVLSKATRARATANAVPPAERTSLARPAFLRPSRG